MNDAVIESASCGQIRSKLSCKPEGVVVIESQDREDEENGFLLHWQTILGA
jgi:hypothetical protein